MLGKEGGAKVLFGCWWISLLVLELCRGFINPFSAEFMLFFCADLPEIRWFLPEFSSVDSGAVWGGGRCYGGDGSSEGRSLSWFL